MRQNKPVYRFEPERQGLHRWKGRVLSPAIFSAHSFFDIDLVRQVVDLMKQRFIQVGSDVEPKSQDFLEYLTESVRRRLEKGGYILLFWSAQAAKNPHVSAELDMALREYPNQVLVATIDGTPIPESLLHLASGTNVVDLATDYRQSRLHTIDDLIVRLYWLVSQNS